MIYVTDVPILMNLSIEKTSVTVCCFVCIVQNCLFWIDNFNYFLSARNNAIDALITKILLVEYMLALALYLIR